MGGWAAGRGTREGSAIRHRQLAEMLSTGEHGEPVSTGGTRAAREATRCFQDPQRTSGGVSVKIRNHHRGTRDNPCVLQPPPPGSPSYPVGPVASVLTAPSLQVRQVPARLHTHQGSRPHTSQLLLGSSGQPMSTSESGPLVIFAQAPCHCALLAPWLCRPPNAN